MAIEIDSEDNGSAIGVSTSGTTRRPEDPNYLTTEEITLDTTLEEIPDGPGCLVCAIPIVKTYVRFELGLVENKTLFVAPHAAGYRYPADGMEYLSQKAVMETLGKARQMLLSRDHDASVVNVDRTILFQLRHKEAI